MVSSYIMLCMGLLLSKIETQLVSVLDFFLFLNLKDIYLVNTLYFISAEFLDRFPVNLFLQNSIGQQKVFFFLTLNSLRWLPQLLNLAGI